MCNRKGWSAGLPCRVVALLLLLFLPSATGLANNTESPDAARTGHVALLQISGAIGPATTDYLLRAMGQAIAAEAGLIVLTLDTPGGLSEAMRDMIKRILASPVPVVTYVSPSGARAASAGTYILYASHVAAMAPATTLGAATPVQIGPGALPGGDSPPDQPASTDPSPETASEEESRPPADTGGPSRVVPGNAVERKAVNDAVAYIRALADRHGRNADWAELAVREAVSLSAEEALAQNVVDIVAPDLPALLTRIDGREVVMTGGKLSIASADRQLVSYPPDWRNELLALITNPQVAYILLLIGVYGLIFEGYNPGALVPGIVGAICLLLALYALQLLPVNYAGLGLMLLGIVLMAVEAFVPSFGVLGVGGVVAFVLGSLMLIDTDVPGMAISRGLIAAIAVAGGLFMLAIITLLARFYRRPVAVSVSRSMLGQVAQAVAVQGRQGSVRIQGVWWQIVAAEPLREGQWVEVCGQQGLTLQVRPVSSQENSDV